MIKICLKIFTITVEWYYCYASDNCVCPQNKGDVNMKIKHPICSLLYFFAEFPNCN